MIFVTLGKKARRKSSFDVLESVVIMEFLWVLLILFIVCPPLGAVVGLFVGLVGMILTPILLWVAYQSDKSMHDGGK